MQRLTERDSNGDVYVKQHDYVTAADKLAEYEDLDEQRLLLKLPCKVGDALYHILACTTAEDFGKKYVSSFMVTHIIINTTKEVAIRGRDVCDRDWWIIGRDIGKTVFLTKEEAEAKLREMEE